ncbi:MAG: hypothetical protein ACREQI_12680 [Candidatus Binataceae bacterium]
MAKGRVLVQYMGDTLELAGYGARAVADPLSRAGSEPKKKEGKRGDYPGRDVTLQAAPTKEKVSETLPLKGLKPPRPRKKQSFLTCLLTGEHKVLEGACRKRITFRLIRAEAGAGMGIESNFTDTLAVAEFVAQIARTAPLFQQQAHICESLITPTLSIAGAADALSLVTRAAAETAWITRAAESFSSSSIARIAAETTLSVARVADASVGSLPSILAAMDRFYEHTNQAFAAGEAFAEYAWTIPLQATPDELFDLAGKIHDAESADNAFAEFYSEDDFARLSSLEQGLLESGDLQSHRPLLQEAILDLKDQRYRVCAMALLPMIEGLFASKFSEPHFESKSQRRRFFDDHVAAQLNGSLTESLWRSVKRVTEVLFQASSFDDDTNRPTIINRHRVLHGRDVPQDSLTDCIRLLHALDTIAAL